jgi:signal transduction histidine kinase
VNDFLDSSKLEQGKMVFNLAPVTLKPLFVSIKSDLQSLAEQQSDQIVFSDLDNLPQVIADETRLRQIFYNMLSNAIKYSERATITVTGQREGSKLRIRVADTGKGISPESQKLLFHKFQQAGDSLLTRDNTKGTGLGLYIAKLLADNMHGSIELEHSEVGKGSVFAVVMPVADR